MPSQTRRPAAKRRTRTAGKSRKSHPQPSPLISEVKYLCIAALGVLLFLSIYVNGGAGFVGLFVKDICFGLVGFGAYVLPAALIVIPLYALFSKTKNVQSHVLIKSVLLFWCLVAWPNAFTEKALPNFPNVIEYFKTIYAEGGASNGGLFGALLGNLLRTLLGRGGACVALAVGLLVTLVLLTGRSFVAAVTFIAGKFRYVADGLMTVEEYDEPDDELPPPAPAPVRERRIKTLPKPKPEFPVIEERPETERGRVLLVTEEITRPAHPLFKKRDAGEKPAAPPHVLETAPEIMPPRPREAVPAPAAAVTDEFLDMPNPTVRGLVEGGEPDGGLFGDQPPFDIDPAPPRPREKKPVKPAVDIEVKSETAGYEHYQYPPLNFLTKPQPVNNTGSRAQILENSRILEETLRSFKVEAKVIEVSVGPTVTRYDMAPGPGVKVATIANLSNDLALNLAAQGIRIEAPIPGKAAVGIEVPNKEPQPVLLREIIEDDAFQKYASRLAFAVGKDIAGAPVVTDVARMPHLLIAGATGSGKSVCINTLITSLLYKSRPDEVKLLMIDPKVVELSVYNGIPHLLIPVVTDPKKASGALSWAVTEMDNRYNLFADAGTRDIKGYNEYLSDMEPDTPPLPQIIIIIDELADLMMVAKGEVEDSICRLAQKARAAGLHLIVATQRPSVDVITGLIKANIPSRLAFAVSSGIDSRTVLDMYGAEKLLGKGDMLFLPMGRNKPIRLQGCFISEREVENIVEFLKKQHITEYPQEMIERVTSPGAAALNDEDLDEFFREAVDFLIEKGKASTSMLQRQFRIGYNRASRMMEDLESRGIVGPEDGVKPRKVLITRTDFEELYGEY